MDLRRSLRVLWRFRFLVVAGVIAGLALAFLAYVRVEVSGGSVRLAYRSSQTWQSGAVLLITQPGFPWGRSVTQAPQAVGEDVSVIPAPRFGDADRFENLAALYSAMATSDPVRSIMLREGPVDGTLTASPVLSTELLDSQTQAQLRTFDVLPVMRLSAQATDPTVAKELVSRQLLAFQTYLESEQDASRIPESKRVLATVLKAPGDPQLVDGRSKAYALLIALAVIALAILLAFVLENIWPARHPADSKTLDGRRQLPPARTAERAER